MENKEIKINQLDQSVDRINGLSKRKHIQADRTQEMQMETGPSITEKPVSAGAYLNQSYLLLYGFTGLLALVSILVKFKKKFFK